MLRSSAARSSSSRIRLALAVCALTAGCDEPASPTPRPLPDEPAAAPVSPRTTEAAFELHEWGLIALDARAEAPGLASGPHVSVVAHADPVIYAHLAEPGSARFSVEIGARPLETWPALPRAEPIAWRDVRAEPDGSCGLVSYPRGTDPACRTGDDFCEAMHADRYESPDGACLLFERGAYEHLLYRAEVPRDALPIDARREGDRVIVTSRAGAPPLRLLRVRAHRSGHTLASIELDAPPAGASLELSAPLEEGALERVEAFLARAHAEGLTDDESTIFRGVWRPVMIGTPQGGRDPSPAARYALEPRARPPLEAVYAWLPRETIDRVLPLTVTPAPRGVARAFLVRVGLDPAQPSGAVEEFDTIGLAVHAEIAAGPGRLAAPVVERVARRYLNQLRFCVEQTAAREDRPYWAPFEIEAHLELATDGTSTSAIVAPIDEWDAVQRCVEQAVRRWSWPQSEAPTSVTLRWDVRFELSERP